MPPVGIFAQIVRPSRPKSQSEETFVRVVVLSDSLNISLFIYWRFLVK